MKDYCSYVNVFQGCGEINLPKAERIASRWKFIKGLCGNNTPAASLPFGKINAGCFCGGYSSGYGNLKKNTHGKIERLFDKNKFRGISHLQNDGTGDIGVFYNYAVVSPYLNNPEEASQPRDFYDETAQPGYYACRDSLTGALCEVTVTRLCAMHRITFGADEGSIFVDFSNDGLYEDGKGLHFPAGKAEIKITAENEAEISAVLHGIPVYFCIKASGIKGALKIRDNNTFTESENSEIPENHCFGIAFDTYKCAEISISISPKSIEKARLDIKENVVDFDTAKSMAYDEWNRYLSAIDVRFDDQKDYEIFYSNLYHSLTKPCDFYGESFIYDDDDFVSDFATLWDQYKTAFPLHFTFWSDISSKIVRTIINYADKTGSLPHTLMLCSDNEKLSTNQARMLAAFTIADAYYRSVDFDVEKALRAVYGDLVSNGFDKAAKNAEKADNLSFVVDITDACAACADVAEEIGETALAAEFRKTADLWSAAYDEKTGLIKDKGTFYEGTAWNYSFRLIHSVDERIRLAGGKENFCRLADKFFGFTDQDENASVFEGFNNETDMETPYIYHFAGRHDRISEIISASFEFIFTSGRGGLPGNNDSGGLSSCYIWNALGIFPVSGQDVMIIGYPLCRKSVLSLAGRKNFTIIKNGNGIYIDKAELNGNELKSLSFSVREMIKGGTLELTMSEKPIKR